MIIFKFQMNAVFQQKGFVRVTKVRHSNNSFKHLPYTQLSAYFQSLLK